jgi:hypothetical protein
MQPRHVIVVAVVAAALTVLAVNNIRNVPWPNSAARGIEPRGPLSDTERQYRALRARLTVGCAGRGAVRRRYVQ